MGRDFAAILQGDIQELTVGEQLRDDALFVDCASYHHLDRTDVPWNRAALVRRLQDPMAGTAAWQLSAHEVWGGDRQILSRADSNAHVVFALKESGWQHYELQPLETIWGFGVPLVGDWAVDLLAEVVDEVRHLRKASPERIVLTGISPNATAHADLHARFSRRFDLWVSSKPMLQCAASLDGGVEGFLGRRTGNFRRKLRQQQRRATEAGVTVEHLSPKTLAEADRCFARMVAVEQRSWKGLGRCGMDGPDTIRFYRAMLRRLALLGRARIGFARTQDTDIGFIFGGVVGSIYRGQQFSFDQHYAHLSIGNLLQFDQVVRLCEEGITRYDLGPLLGPRMDYKAHWIEVELPIITCELRAA